MMTKHLKVQLKSFLPTKATFVNYSFLAHFKVHKMKDVKIK